MSESESSESDKEPNTQKLPENISTQEIDDSYSDSDDENLKSLYNVNKPSHIPGRYKYSMDQDSGKSIGANQTLEKQEYDEQGKDNFDKMTEDSSKNEVCEKRIEENDERVADSTEKLDDNLKSLSDTGFFGKSMVMVSLGDLEKAEHPVLEKKSPPPVPPKPDRNLKRKSESKENTEAPKPAPRMTHKKKIIDTYTEDKLLLTDESFSKDKVPIPSQRVERKQLLPASLQQEQEDIDENGEEMTCDKDKFDEEENLEDTVDFGPAHDHEDNETNVTKTELSDENRDNIITDDTHQANMINTEVRGESMASFIIQETPETSEGDIKEESFKQQGDNIITDDDIHSQNKDFDNDGNKDETTKGTDTEPGCKEAILEPNSDDESAGRYDNDFQEADSTKDNSDSDSEYGTAESQSDKENEISDTNSPGKSGGDVDEISISNDKNDISFPAESMLKTLSSNIEESFEVIGKGTVYKGYESISSTISSGEILKSADSVEDDIHGGDKGSEITSSRKSVRDMTSRFENMSSNSYRPTRGDHLHLTRPITKQDKTEEKGEREKSPVISSATSSSSVDVLSLADEEELEDHTDSARQAVQDSEQIEKESSVQHTDDIPTTEELKPARPDANVTESESHMSTTSGTDPDVKIPVDRAFDRDGTQDDANFDTSFVHEIEDLPPPVAPKSDLVLESMRSLAMEYDSPPKIPPKSLPVEKHKLDEQFEESQSSYTNVESWTHVSGLNIQQQEAWYPHFNQGEQKRPQAGEIQYPSTGAPTHTDQWDPNQQLQGYNQQQMPFYGQHHQYPVTSQPYYYYDQAGNIQYPLAYPNQYQQYPGMYYQTPDGQYFQQPLYYPNPVSQSTPQQYPHPPQSGVPTSMQPFHQDYTRLSYDASTGRETGYNSVQHDERMYERLNTNSQHLPEAANQTKGMRHDNQADDGYVEIGDVKIEIKESKSDQLLEAKTAERQSASPVFRRAQSEIKKGGKGSPMQQSKPKKQASKKEVTHQQEVKRQQVNKQNVEQAKIKEENIEAEEHYIFFKGINPNIKKDNLGNFVEIMTQSEVDSKKIIFNSSSDCALVVANSKPDLSKGRERIVLKGMEGFYPEIFDIDPPTCIAVSCEKEIKNAEGLEYYFENNKRSGGSEVKERPYESDDGSCIVIEFVDPAAVKRVCEWKKPHTYDDKTLRVSPYYICEAGAIWDSDLHVVRIPEPIVIVLEINRRRFLEKCCCKQLFSKLTENQCLASFVSEGLKVECVLTPKIPGFKNLVKEWEQTSRKVVDVFIDENIVENKILVSGENKDKVWLELKMYIETEHIETMDGLVVSLDGDLLCMRLIGFAAVVVAQEEKLIAKRDEIMKRLRIKSEKIVIDPLKARLLCSVGIFDKMRDSDFKITINGGNITAVGQPEDVSASLCEIYEAGERINTCKWKHSFSREFVSFIEGTLSSKLTQILKKSGFKVEWEVNPTEINFCIYNERKESDYHCIDEEDDDPYARIDEIHVDQRNSIIRLFETSLYEAKDNVQKDAAEVLKSPEWTSMVMHLTEQYETAAEVEFKQAQKQLLVYGLEKEAKELHKQTMDFLDNNVIKKDELRHEPMRIKFIKNFKPEALTTIEKSFEKCKVKLVLEDTCINIKGTKDGVHQAKIELNKLLDSIISEKHSIKKVAVNEVFRDQKDQGIVDIVEKDTRCLVQVPGDSETYQSSAYYISDDDSGEDEPAVIKEKKDGYTMVSMEPPRGKSFRAQNGVTVTIVKGEIGQQHGDIMVVATSPNLNLSSGAAAKSILRVGGETLQDQCKQLYPNDIKNGEIAVIRGGGGLKCQRVYLTTLPNWSSEGDPKKILQTVMNDSLEMGSTHNKRSILFCAMGTGQLKYPTDLVAMLMYQAVIDFDQKHPKTSLKDVQFILYQKDWSTIKAFEEEEMMRIEGGGKRTKLELKKGSITIELSVENIAEQKVGGILCSTAPNMDLSRSGACQALLRSGGNSLQDECKTKYNNKLEPGQVVDIGGGKLPCTSVFLTVIPSYSADAIDILRKVIQTFLGLAHAKQFTSVALPALGTGFLKYPADEVCRCMFETVSDWAMKNQKSCLKTVRFIMHAKDHAVIQKFKSHVLNAQGKGIRKGRTFSLAPGDIGPKLKAGSKFNAHEKGIKIGKIKMTVLLGDILEQKTDVVVSSVGKDFEFIGAVADQLKKRCPGLEEKCKKKLQDLKTEGAVLTEGFGLPASSIVHVQFSESTGEWKKKIKKCLVLANNHKAKTIAFPILGTGKGFTTFSPEAMAECFYEAVTETVDTNKKPTIKEVRLIVYKGQPLMLDVIMKKLHLRLQETVTGSLDGSWRKAFTKRAKKIKQYAESWFTGIEPGTMSAEERKQYFSKSSSLELVIYSDNKLNIDQCKRALDAKLENAYTKKKIDNYKELITTVTPEELKELDIVALANINVDRQGGVITVEGPIKPVSDVVHELQMRLLKIERRRHDISAAEELFKIVQWHYEEITDTEFKPVAYTKPLNHKIEQAYKKQDRTFEFTDDDGVTFVIDFQNLVEYPKDNKDDSLRVIRKDILKAAISKLPDEWIQMKDNENIKVVTLQATDPAYKAVETRFMTEVKTGSYSHRYTFSVANLQINKIERIQNKTLYQQYMAKKKQMSEQKPNLPANMPIERDLWHGTKNDAVTSITMHGFNRSYSGNANGDPWYGEGVYFAGDASYSARGWLSGAGSGGKGYMFLVKTLTGQFCKGVKKMRYLPPVDAKNATVLYDCAVDDPANPLEFVIFNDTQAYPAYIITFQT